MRAFARSLRARRKLIRLAPHDYDPVVIQRDEERRERNRLHDEKFAIAVDSVYGPGSRAEVYRRRAQEEEWLRRMSSATRRAVERWSAERELWFQAGSEALHLFKAHAHHRLLSLQRIAQLIDLASQLGRAACDMPRDHNNPPKPDPQDLEQGLTFEEQLKKIYGDEAWAQRERTSSTISKP